MAETKEPSNPDNSKKVIKAEDVQGNTKAGDIHDKIIEETYDVTTSSSNKCDILGKYKWSIDTYKVGDVSSIPYCYLSEYKQTHNSVISNLINSISAAVTSISDEGNQTALKEGFDKIKQLSSVLTNAAIGELSKDTISSLKNVAKTSEEIVTDTADAMGEGVEKVKNTETAQKFAEFGSGLMAALEKGWDMISNAYNVYGANAGATTEGGGGFLKPYKLLYWLSPTHKQYTFPMLSELPTYKLSNAYGDTNSDSSRFTSNSLLSTIADYASDTPSAVRDLVDLSKMISQKNGGGGSFSGAFVEKAKFYQYPQDTDEYTIQFPLINTVRSSQGIPEWKKNYKFIVLFSLRNMIFRKDNAEYYPPLFYDLYIPGIIRQPYCYVSSVDAQPVGITRIKECAGLFGFLPELKETSIKVPVPEMWLVTIKLKSLVPTSANMVLSSMFDLPINNKTINKR